MEQNHKPAKDQFDDNSVKTLEWNEHIQRRPEMYFGQLGDGSDPKDGIYTLLKGVLVMAMDEFQMGFGKGFSVEVKNDYAVVGITVEEFRWSPLCRPQAAYPLGLELIRRKLPFIPLK